MFLRALKKAADSLEVAEDVLQLALAQAGISEGVWSHVREDEFVGEVGGRLKTKGVERTAFRLRAAFATMSQTLKGTPVGLPNDVKNPKDATIEQLVQAVDLHDPNGDIMVALLEKTVPGQKRQKLADVAFFVLGGQGRDVELDRQKTRAVIELFRRGMPPADDELLDPTTKQTYVVYRYDELPTTQTHVIDPLFPDDDLHMGMVSTRFNVIVPRAGWTEEKHRLLLFLRMKEKVKAPKDKPGYEETIALFATDRVEELLDRYGGRGVYEKASRLPIASDAGLPAICHSGTEDDDCSSEDEDDEDV